MYIESHYLAHRSVRKRHNIIYIILATISVLILAVSLGYHKWFAYCWWDFGLTYASTFTPYSNFENETSVSEVYSDSCQSLKTFVEDNCPDFCTYIQNFEAGGIIMIIFGSLSLLFQSICILFHVWSYFKVQFKFDRIWIFLVLPCILYMIGLCVYCGLTNIPQIKSPNSQSPEAKNAELKFGFYFSFAVLGYVILLAIYGYFKTRIAFI